MDYYPYHYPDRSRRCRKYILLFLCQTIPTYKTTYIYIDRDDNLDSVYHKIIRNGHPKSMFGFQYLAEKRSMATIYGQDVTLSIHRTICATSSDVFPWDTRLPLI